jgi:hypothetical protein
MRVTVTLKFDVDPQAWAEGPGMNPDMTPSEIRADVQAWLAGQLATIDRVEPSIRFAATQTRHQPASRKTTP